jgi:LuxR family quorum sensing-dependent transcriptional regulator
MAGDHPDQSRETCSAIHLMSIYAHSKARSCAEPTSGAHLLTTREREVLAWLAVGRSTPAVAERLGVTDNTVETHFRSAARKMKVRGRTHAVIEAIRRGEIVP